MRVYRIEQRVNSETLNRETSSTVVGTACWESKGEVGPVAGTVWVDLSTADGDHHHADTNNESAGNDVVSCGRVLLTYRISLVPPDATQLAALTLTNIAQVPSGISVPSYAVALASGGSWALCRRTASSFPEDESVSAILGRNGSDLCKTIADAAAESGPEVPLLDVLKQVLPGVFVSDLHGGPEDAAGFPYALLESPLPEVVAPSAGPPNGGTNVVSVVKPPPNGITTPTASMQSSQQELPPAANLFSLRAVLFWLALRALAKLLLPCWDSLRTKLFSLLVSPPPPQVTAQVGASPQHPDGASLSTTTSVVKSDDCRLLWTQFRRVLDLELAARDQPPLPEAYWELLKANSAWTSRGVNKGGEVEGAPKNFAKDSIKFDWLVFLADMSQLILFNQAAAKRSATELSQMGGDFSPQSRAKSASDQKGSRGKDGARSEDDVVLPAGFKPTIPEATLRASFPASLQPPAGPGKAFVQTESAPGPVQPFQDDTPRTFRVQIASAIHLPLVKNQPPTTFANVFFVKTGSSTYFGGLGDGGRGIGDGGGAAGASNKKVSKVATTSLVRQSTSPDYGFSQEFVIDGAFETRPLQDTVSGLALVVKVFCVFEDRPRLLGVCEVALTPLSYLDKLDGFYDLEAGRHGQVCMEGSPVRRESHS